MNIREPSVGDWNRLINEGLNFRGDVNTLFNFSKMSKKFGLSYLYYLECAYLAKDEVSEEEFCKLNGEIPIGFLNKIR